MAMTNILSDFASAFRWIFDRTAITTVVVLLLTFVVISIIVNRAWWFGALKRLDAWISYLLIWRGPLATRLRRKAWRKFNQHEAAESLSRLRQHDADRDESVAAAAWKVSQQITRDSVDALRQAKKAPWLTAESQKVVSTALEESEERARAYATATATANTKDDY